MENLTQEQREQIALEEFKKAPHQTLAHFAFKCYGPIAISTGAKNMTQNCSATVEGKQYELKMKISIKEIK